MSPQKRPTEVPEVLLAPASLSTPLERYREKAVLLALSGGGDSVGLLRALLEAGAVVVAAHLDHALRPESAQEAAWVSALCTGLGVPLVQERVNTLQVAERKSWNLEHTARTLRYSFLSRAARQHALHTLLTAHTLEDQAETVLFQLLRGSARASGMPATRGSLERPWLGVSRSEVRAYLSALDQPWLEDPSNLDPRFTRNWLRHTVLPLLRQRFPRAEAALARHATYAAEDEAALEGWRASLTPHADWRREPPAIVRRQVAHALRGAGFSLDAAALERVIKALSSESVQHLSLRRSGHKGKDSGGTAPEITVQGGRLWLEPPTFPRPGFAYPAAWTLRHRLPGDTLTLEGGTRTLAEVLIDRKVPRGWRDGLWLLAEGSEVRWLGLEPPLWARGYGQNLTPWWAEMGHALEQASTAALEGEVPVGAVVVRGSEVLGLGRNRSRAHGDMTRHAELEAIRAACERVGAYLSGCTLLVTLEPCPMCLGAALEARLDRVVYAAGNPRMGALGGVSDLLRWHWGSALEVVGGVRAPEGAALLEAFFGALRRNP